MRRIWKAIARTLFWSYERGSWPYDLMVLGILIFVLLTPRHWFQDQPQTSTLTNADVQLVAGDSQTPTKVYRVDADLLPPAKRAPKPTPELVRELHEILGKSADSLKGRTFQVRHIEPMRGKDGTVRYYDVTVKP